MNFQKVIEGFNGLHEWVADKMSSPLETKVGKFILSSMIFLGPISFLPTVYEAWDAPNIEVFKTVTWPMAMLVNIAFWLSLARKGDWQTRLSMIVWIVLMAAMTVAIIVR